MIYLKFKIKFIILIYIIRRYNFFLIENRDFKNLETVREWSSLEKMTEVHRIRLFDYTPSPIVSVSLSGSLSDGHLLVGRENGYIEIWNVKENAFLAASLYVTDKTNIKCASWCRYHNQPCIVIALVSGELMIVEYPSLNSMRPILSGTSESIGALAVNRSQDKIAIACNKSSDSTGFVSIFSTNEELTSVKSDDFESQILSVCFDDIGYVYAGTVNGKICRIDPDTRQIVTTYEASDSSNPCHIFSLTAVPGGCFASGDSNGNVMIWEPNTATVIAKFKSHQYPITALASNDLYLWASGEDPKIATFIYSKKQNSWSPLSNKTRVHDHEVTCLASAGDNLQYCISGSKDTTFFIKKPIYPFQAPPPISSSIRYINNQQLMQENNNENNPPANGPLIVVGASNDYSLTVWKLDGKVAKLELTLKIDSEENRIECVSMRPGGCEFAYSATSVRVLKFTENGHWEFDNEIKRRSYPSASSLAYANDGTLYIGFLNGRILSITRTNQEVNENENVNTYDENTNSSIVERFIDLDFPILKIAVSSNCKYVTAGGFNKIFVLDGDLSSIVCEVPPFGKTPFSTFAFQPFKNRLFIANGGNKIFCFNVKKQLFIKELNIKFDKSGEEVAINSISFADNNHHQMLISSSQRAVIRNIKDPNAKPYRLPYNDILFVTFSGYKKIVIFEKPWIFIVSSVPDVLRVKRFLTRNEENRPRYL